ncbi:MULTISPECIES: hypothetical protein [Bacillaceae]|uniref:Uncharacterized protein n=1 Tax=Domibacillus aminovorans TaxID=29332 RepID=A0A177L9A7_9BACI|nr:MULTISPECIES: hypothetical protein [Bacillaceae]OAH57615.1 hypothetical protein AWH48_18920 [Domibacillus aminovorans]OAH62359.1 hypothetical protein AWH49_10375 [Domibacillus aminovorans]
MNIKDGLICSTCRKRILEKDLVAWTEKNDVVHLICDTIQIREGVKFMGRAEKLKEQIALHENIA